MIVFGTIFFPIIVANNQEGKNNDSKIKPSVSDTLTLYYNYYVAEHDTASHSIKWSFEGSNTYVGITAIAMDYQEFANFKNGNTFTYYWLSHGNYRSDSGEFQVPYSDVWYVIFLNLDPDRQSTSLSYNVVFDPLPIEAVFIGIIIAIVFIGVIVAIVKTRSSKSRAIQASQIQMPPQQPIYQQPPPQQPVYRQSPQNIPIQAVPKPINEYSEQKKIIPRVADGSSTQTKFCSYCGAKVEEKIEYCPSCGSKL